MSFRQAIAELRRIGCSRAQGDSLRAMYAGLIATVHGGDAKKYFAYLTGSDSEIYDKAKELLSSREKAWDVLINEVAQ